jgi:hypothetical protein
MLTVDAPAWTLVMQVFEERAHYRHTKTKGSHILAAGKLLIVLVHPVGLEPTTF